MPQNIIIIIIGEPFCYTKVICQFKYSPLAHKSVKRISLPSNEYTVSVTYRVAVV